MSPRPPRTPDALLAHRQWVRDLARRLCADLATAEDVEQQTWLAALESPPRHTSAPRAWLGTVLRSWLHKSRRGEERRARRERETERRENTPSTAEIVAEAEAHRRVVEAVFTLEEPLRTTVLLRFFEDLPIAEVAARTGVPLETARSRARRAIELLRAALDRDAGGRQAWMAALLPLAQGGAKVAAAQITFGTVLQAIVMNTTQKLMATGALLLLGGALVYLVSTQLAPEAAVAPAASPLVAAPVDAVAAAAEVRAEAAGARSLADGEGVPITVLVRTWSDAPIEGATVEASPPPQGGEGNEYDRPATAATARATSDAQGSVRFTSLPAGRFHFFAEKQGCCRGGVPDVLLRAGMQSGPVVIRLGTGYTLEGRVFRADGSAVRGASVTAIPTSSALVRPRTTSDDQGRYRLDALRAGPVQIAAALPGGTTSPVDTIVVPEVSQLDLVLRTGGILVGKVSDESGQPIAGAKVRAETSRTGYYKPTAAEAVSDAMGRYHIDTLGEGLIHEVHATKEGWVQVAEASDNIDASIPFRDGATWTRDVVMGHGGRLSVSVRGPGGPVADAQVTVQQTGRGSYRQKAATDNIGQAKFAAVASGRSMVSVRADGLQQPRFPTDSWRVLNDPTAKSPYVVEVRVGATATIEIEMAKDTAIAGRVLGPDEQGLAGALVNFANASDARGAAVTGVDGSFRLAGARAGSVELSLTKDDFVPVGACVADVPEAGELTGLVLRMAQAPPVSGTVRCTGARPGESYVQVSMVPDREQAWQEDFRWANTPRRPIAADGSYDLPLPRGEGRFAVHAVAVSRPAVTTAPIAVVPGQASYQADLELEEGHALIGRVVGLGTTDGVAGARIRAEWLAPGEDEARMIRGPDDSPTIGIGDPAGRFALNNLRPGRWHVSAIADGFLAESTEVRLPQAGELSIALPAEYSIEGVVQYPDGTPVAAAQVMPEPQQGNRSLTIGVDQFSMSAPDGHFKLPRLQPGQYRINVMPPRTGTANFRRTRTGIVAAGAHDVRVVVEPGAVIAGRVLDGESRPLAGVPVGARGNNDERMGVETLQDGTFTLVGLQDGASYTVVVNAGGGFSSKPFASLQRGFVAAGTVGLEFVLRPGLSIDGVVLDAAGNPVSNVEISAAPIAGGDPYGPMGWTDQSGKFEIRGLQEGHYRLQIPQWFPRGLLLTGGDDVAAGASGLQLRATDGAKIGGIAVDEAGSPLATVEVSVEASEASVHSSTWGRSRADGGFELAGLVPGASYEVSARLRGRVAVQLHAVAAGTGDLRLVLARGMEVHGRLLDGAEKPLAGINLRFASGALHLAARTGGDGTFTVTGMTPGHYSVEASLGNVERMTLVPCGTVEAGQHGVELHLRQ